MVIKTFIAATCTALFAGGLVYFSTDPADPGGKIAIDNSAAVSPETAQKKDIYARYIGSDGNEAPEIAQLANTPPTETAKSENPYIVIEEDVEVSSSEVLPAQEISRLPVEAPQVAEPPRTSKPVVKKIGNSDRRPPVRKKQTQNANGPAEQRIEVVFEQAENITQPDLRDRAYLDLADYATSKGLFDSAQEAALKINQVELRDTARSRIAMGMARYGKSDEAFALIEAVEVDELRDVMRLQVIEALLGTDNRR